MTKKTTILTPLGERPPPGRPRTRPDLRRKVFQMASSIATMLEAESERRRRIGEPNWAQVAILEEALEVYLPKRGRK